MLRKQTMLIKHDDQIINIDKNVPFYYVISEKRDFYLFNFFTESDDKRSIQIHFKSKKEIDYFIKKLILEDFKFIDFDFLNNDISHTIGFYLNNDFVISMEKEPRYNDYKIIINNMSSVLSLSESCVETFVDKIESADFITSKIIKVKNRVLIIPEKTSFFYKNDLNVSVDYINLYLISPVTKQKIEIIPFLKEESMILINKLKNNFSIVHLENYNSYMFGFHYVEDNFIAFREKTKTMTVVVCGKFDWNITLSLKEIYEKLNLAQVNSKLNNF